MLIADQQIKHAKEKCPNIPINLYACKKVLFYENKFWLLKNSINFTMR